MKKILLAAALLWSSTLFAQPGPTGDPDGAPIDGGVSLLIAGAIGYGAKKVRDARKKKIDAEKEK